MVDPNLLFDKDFLKNISEIELSDRDIDAIYAYLSLFEEDMNDEEKAFWSLFLEKKDPEYDISDEENTDSDT